MYVLIYLPQEQYSTAEKESDQCVAMSIVESRGKGN